MIWLKNQEIVGVMGCPAGFRNQIIMFFGIFFWGLCVNRPKSLLSNFPDKKIRCFFQQIFDQVKSHRNFGIGCDKYTKMITRTKPFDCKGQKI